MDLLSFKTCSYAFIRSFSKKGVRNWKGYYLFLLCTSVHLLIWMNTAWIILANAVVSL